MPKLDTTQLHSNFELNSKLSNFTRDSFKTWSEMQQVNPNHMDEGHISYCEGTRKHYVFHTVNNTANWTELDTNQITSIGTPVEELVVGDVGFIEALKPGSLVFVEPENKLYYKKADEGEVNENNPISTYLFPILTEKEINDTYLKIGSAHETYLSIGSARDTYLTIDTAYDAFLTKSSANTAYLSKTEASDTYLSKNEASRTYLKIDSADEEYLSKNEAVGTYLKIDSADEKYLTKVVADNTYLGSNVISSTYLSKTEASGTYLTIGSADENFAKKEDIAGLIDKYIPADELNSDSVYIINDIAEGLQGQTGKQIRDHQYALNEIFDKILFKEGVPETTIPSLNIHFNLNGWREEINPTMVLQNENIIISKDSTPPNSGFFIGTDIVNAQIKYLNGDQNYTRGIITNSSNKLNSIVFCKIQQDDEWIEYQQDGSHIPDSFEEPGNYRYYYRGYFYKDNPLKNNKEQSIRYWDENTPIESKNYVELNVSKPVRYYTRQGWVENTLVKWDAEMIDYFDLAATCQVEQKFKLPRQAKHIYMWNDLCGYAEDLSFVETQEDDYFIYTYDHQTEGHRGAIKIKVEF